MNLENLTPEQREKALSCKSPKEILALAAEEGYELSDDELEQVSGGLWDGSVSYNVHCAFCGWSANLSEEEYHNWSNICPGCGALLIDG